jgi:hypothetical protein
MAIRSLSGGSNIPALNPAYDRSVLTLFRGLDKTEDIYGELTLAATCHLNGTVVTVPCAAALMGAPYWFSTGAMSGTDNVTVSGNAPTAIRVSSAGNVELTWNAADNTAGDVIGGANAVIFVEGRRVRRR